MSTKAGARRRAQAVLRRPRGLRARYRTSSAAAGLGGTFAGKISKTAKKSGGGK
jgi:hypothetical protein